MLDLIGFWTGVSLSVVFLGMPILVIAAQLVYIFVKQVTDDHSLASTAEKKVVEWDNYSNSTIFFTKLRMHERLATGSILFSVIAWCIIGAITCRHGITVVEVVSISALKCAPFLGYVGAAVGTYMLALFVSRRLWSLHIKVATLLDKAEEK